MNKNAPPEPDQEISNDLLPEYHFDYTLAHPNRFAAHLPRDLITVTLDPDVAAVFTTSESVNQIPGPSSPPCRQPAPPGRPGSARPAAEAD